MVVEILVAEAEGEDALLEELGEGVLDAVGVAVVGEAGGELVDEVELGLDLAQKQGASVGGDGAAVEAGADGAGAEGFPGEMGGGTVCGHRAVLVRWRNGR